MVFRFCDCGFGWAYRLSVVLGVLLSISRTCLGQIIAWVDETHPYLALFDNVGCVWDTAHFNVTDSTPFTLGQKHYN